MIPALFDHGSFLFRILNAVRQPAQISSQKSRQRVLRLIVATGISLLLVNGPVTATTDSVEHRIINGAPVPAGKYPWMVALLSPWQSNTAQAQFCGGTLIQRNWVLTAARCVRGLEPRDIQVAVNRVDLGGEINRLGVRKIVAHANFALGGFSDVALLQLKRRLPASVRTIRLVEPDSNPEEGTSLVTMGWGVTERSRPSRRLREARVLLASSRNCSRYPIRYFENHELCVSSTPSRSQGTCLGDNGGPLIARDPVTQRYVQIGITSWGAPDCNTERSDVFTRLDVLAPWIRRQLTNQAEPGEVRDLSFLSLDYCKNFDCVFDASYARLDRNHPPVSRYIWRTDDGAKLAGADARLFEHKFSTRGTHKVQLILVYENGRRYKKDISVEIPVRSFGDRYRRRDTFKGRLNASDDLAVHYLGVGQGVYFYDGSVDLRLTGPRGADFDLALLRFDLNRNRWDVVSVSDKVGSNESINLGTREGFHTVAVYSYRGSGSYQLTAKAYQSRRDSCLLTGLLNCRARQR